MKGMEESFFKIAQNTEKYPFWLTKKSLVSSSCKFHLNLISLVIFTFNGTFQYFVLANYSNESFYEEELRVIFTLGALVRH